jgi:hypothetical protein
MLVKSMATDRTIVSLRAFVRSLRCDPRTFFAIVLGRIAKVAPQERQSLRPSSSFLLFFSIFFPAGVRSQFQRVKLSLKKY